MWNLISKSAKYLEESSSIFFSSNSGGVFQLQLGHCQILYQKLKKQI